MKGDRLPFLSSGILIKLLIPNYLTFKIKLFQRASIYYGKKKHKKHCCNVSPGKLTFERQLPFFKPFHSGCSKPMLYKHFTDPRDPAVFEALPRSNGTRLERSRAVQEDLGSIPALSKCFFSSGTSSRALPLPMACFYVNSGLTCDWGGKKE